MKSAKVLLTLLCLSFVLPAFSLIKLPQLVADGMVLQRNTPVNIWGWASAGEKITITFHQHSYHTLSTSMGAWSIVLPPMPAGGPYTMELQGENRLLIHDILIGDVWFCSGQSNMVLPMERVKERYPHEIATAEYPQIRNFFVRTEADVRNRHTDLLPGKWVKCDSSTVLSFGATSWFFARKLWERSHIPVGIINSSVGGTPIEAWVSSEGLNSTYTSRIGQFSDPVFMDSVLKKQPVWKDPFNSGAGSDLGLSGPTPWFATTYIPQHWHHFWLPGYWADQGVKNLNGIVWFRKEITLPLFVNGRSARLFMGRIIDADQVYINGRLIGSTTYQYPPRRYDLPAGVLRPGKNILVIRVVNTSGKGGFVADKPYFLKIGADSTDLRGDWQYKVGLAMEPVSPKAEFITQNEPTALFNTMVAPAILYTIKGFLWYQGESNTSKAASYAGLLKSLITDWRKNWKQGALPFIYAQLPAFNEVCYSPVESEWAELREGQLQALVLPNTGMAVTLDAGEWNDIHPLNKKSVGERLALAAEKIAYGNTRLVCSGPVYTSSIIAGSEIQINFRDTGSGLCTNDGNKLSQFSIAAADKKFVWAHARIEGNRIIVSADKISTPLYVRYAWADNPEGANLSNKEGLPASPFRTDQP